MHGPMVLAIVSNRDHAGIHINVQAVGSQMVTFFNGPFVQSGNVNWAYAPVAKSNAGNERLEVNMMPVVWFRSKLSAPVWSGYCCYP